MEPFDCLTQEDRETIKDYIEIITQRNIDCDLRQILSSWNDNKGDLFKMFGGKLRRVIDFPSEGAGTSFADKSIEGQILTDRGDIFYSSHRKCFIFYDVNSEPVQDDVQRGLEDFFKYVSDLISVGYLRGHQKGDKVADSILTTLAGNTVSSLFNARCLALNELKTTKWFKAKDKKELRIDERTKPMRAIQKFAKYIDYPNMENIELFRNYISNLRSAEKLMDKNKRLVISIHPIDFLTLSDNNCGWSSCMRTLNACGLYSSTITEMMNSKVAIVAYIENTMKDFIVEGHKIPNKNWRQLFYCDADIVLEGNPYPFAEPNLSDLVFDELLSLRGQSGEKEYGRIDQKLFYQDGAIDGYSNCEDPEINFNIFCAHYDVQNVSILKDGVYPFTYTYFNDFVANDFAIFRYVKSNNAPAIKTICLSGVPTCLHCGKPKLDMDKIMDEINETLPKSRKKSETSSENNYEYGYFALEDFIKKDDECKKFKDFGDRHRFQCKSCLNDYIFCSICNSYHLPEDMKTVLLYNEFTCREIYPKQVCENCLYNRAIRMHRVNEDGKIKYCYIPKTWNSNRQELNLRSLGWHSEDYVS